MKGEAIARFFELRGWRIAQGAGAYWLKLPRRFYKSLPTQLIFDSDPAEISTMLRREHGVGALYPSHRPGLPRGLYVCRIKNYDLSSVRRGSTRHRVRKGLERCQIRRVEESELLRQGLQLNLDTMKRQERFNEEFSDPVRWKRVVEAARQVPAVEVVGAFVGGRLAAYAVLCREDGWLHIVHQKSRTNDLENCPNHALTFHVTKEAAEDPGLEGICYGSVDLIHYEGLHQFKTRMGYELIPHNLAIQFHPALSPILTSARMDQFVSFMQRLRPNHSRLERLSSVLEGARLARQESNSMRCSLEASGQKVSKPGVD